MWKELLFLILVIFGVFRISHVVTREDGPLDVFHKYREVIIKKWGYGSWQARGCECLWCMSVWVSFAGALLFASNVLEWVIYSFGIAGIVLALDKLTNKEK